MGFFRFHRRIKILPGVHWSIGKKSSSVSFGGRGLTYTIGPKGSRTTVGVPGTGLSYTHIQSNPPQPTPSSMPPAPAKPLPPPLAGSASPQYPQTRRTSKVFYTAGSILLAIWLLNKVFEQNQPNSPVTNGSSSSSDSRAANDLQTADTATIQ